MCDRICASFGKPNDFDKLTDQNPYPGNHWFGFFSWTEWITDNRCDIAQIWHEIIYRLYMHHTHAYKHTTEIKTTDMDFNQSPKSYLLNANVSFTENFALLNLWYVMVHYTWSNANIFFCMFNRCWILANIWPFEYSCICYEIHWYKSNSLSLEKSQLEIWKYPWKLKYAPWLIFVFFKCEKRMCIFYCKQKHE